MAKEESNVSIAEPKKVQIPQRVDSAGPLKTVEVLSVYPQPIYTFQLRIKEAEALLEKLTGTAHDIMREQIMQAEEKKRLRVPFNVQFIEGSARPPDKQLLEKLKAEWPGILAWAVRGNLARIADGGLPAPAKVKAATAEYRGHEDVVAEALGEITVADPSAWESTARLREAFERESGLHWRRTVEAKLKAMGCRPERRVLNGVPCRGWAGIRFMTDDGS